MVRYHVHVETVPRPFLVLGVWETETYPAGRGVVVAASGIARAVRELSALPDRVYGAPVKVSVCGRTS